MAGLYRSARSRQGSVSRSTTDLIDVMIDVMTEIVQSPPPHSLAPLLLSWYDRAGRTLPWRGGSDLYAILVSELMLQQTRVDTVLGYWSRFMERFPTVADLAAAAEDDVMAAWSGLGFYRRLWEFRSQRNAKP